jgi:murein DD-endopeptidase MepM/ murein hydrolase activator NlpD
MTHLALSLLAAASVKGSLACVAGLAAAALLRRAAPGLRHLILLLALSSFLAIPLWQVTLPPLAVATPAVPGIARAVAALAAAGEPAATDSSRASIAPTADAADGPARVDAAALLLGAWALGALVMGGRSLAAVRPLRRLRRSAAPLPEPIGHAMRRLADRVAPRRHVAVMESSIIDVPLTLGVLAPLVLLPCSMTRGGADALAAVAAHELAHVQRRDVLTAGISYAICSVFWFTPFSWFALARLRVEQELACDQAAAGLASSASRYAEALLRLRASVIQPRLLARFSAQAGGEKALEERIRGVLRTRKGKTMKRPTRISATIAACALMAPLAMTRCAPAAAPAVATAAAGAARTAAAPSFAPVWPLGDGVSGAITLAFGQQVNPITKKEFNHTGVDIAARLGTPVLASADGTVTDAGFAADLGNHLTVKHEGGWETSYSHLQKLLVGNGERVAASQAIGLVGSTGQSTGPHVHYEIRYQGAAVDPLTYPMTSTLTGSMTVTTVTTVMGAK